MAFQPSADSFGIHHLIGSFNGLSLVGGIGEKRLGFKSSWWHRREANDTIASE